MSKLYPIIDVAFYDDILDVDEFAWLIMKVKSEGIGVSYVKAYILDKVRKKRFLFSNL
ncbi:MAG: hypothetical protein KAI50_14520 [Desulfobacterales bacterium]|nr:hypothetical protein [Desulfobacterales bacterium]